LKSIGEKPAGAKLLQQAVSESKQRFHLKDLMNVPMQRILKYPLLMKVMLSVECFDSKILGAY
jgi:hypothetical protein